MTKKIDIHEAMKSKDPKEFIEGYVQTVAKNAALIAKYPFLLPLNYKNEVIEGCDFSFTEADMVPDGWKNLIIDLSEELMEYFRKNNIDPYSFHIDQLKEKYGSIRLYYSLQNGTFQEDDGIDAIIQKYEQLSEHTCCECGAEATLMSTGWICPYCQKCADALKAKESSHLEFVPLERSVWKKL